MNNSLGQTTLYTQNFGTGTTFPTGWTTSGTQPWSCSVNSSSSGYTGASGGSNALHTNIAATGTLTFSNNLSTVGYTNITVLWGANRTGNNVTTFQYSIDGTTWTTVSFTEATNNSTWMLVNGGTRISLPANAAGVSNLRFRWTHTGDNSPSNFIRMDDFTVQGTFVCPTITASATKNDVSCFNTSTGVITITGSGGASPYSFSIDNITNYNATVVAGASYVPINATSGKFINLPIGTYKIRVKDNNGCESKSVQ
jgi:hypothetical protein